MEDFDVNTLSPEDYQTVMSGQNRIGNLVIQHSLMAADRNEAILDNDELKRVRLTRAMRFLEAEMRATDAAQKELIRKNIPLQYQESDNKCTCPPGLAHELRHGCPYKNQYVPPVMKKPRVEAPFPDVHTAQSEFLSNFRLVTRETRNEILSGMKKVERRRRTTTHNPKYSNNGFLQLDHVSLKRPRRLQANESPTDQEPIIKGESNTSEACGQAPKISPLSCFVCEQMGCNLTCESCTTKFHDDCIKVTGSRAPTPLILLICPKCVQASNKPPTHRVMTRTSSKPLSIMSPSSKLNKSSKVSEPIPSSSANLQQSTARLVSSLREISKVPACCNSTATSSSATKSSEFSGLIDSFVPNTKKEVFATKSKPKVVDQHRNVKEGTRIAQVKLNMKRELTPPTRPAPLVPPKLNSTKNKTGGLTALKWKNKNHNLRKNTRRRIPCVTSTEIANSQRIERENIANLGSEICGGCIKTQSPVKSDVTATGDENADLHPSLPIINTTGDVAGCASIKSEIHVNEAPSSPTSLFYLERSSMKNSPQKAVKSSEAKEKCSQNNTNALKVHPPSSLSVKKTIIAMSAAAACVMSTTTATSNKPCTVVSSSESSTVVGVKDNSQSMDLIMDSISSVIARAVSEDHYHLGQTPSPDPEVPATTTSPVKQEIDPCITNNVLLPLGDADVENTPNSSMQGQMSDTEELLSLSNSPTISMMANHDNELLLPKFTEDLLILQLRESLNQEMMMHDPMHHQPSEFPDFP